jgi:hypothetical protein
MKTWVTLILVCFFLAAIGCSASRPKLDTSPVVISELHFHPSDAQGSAEFIEIANITPQSVDLGDWQVTGAGRTAIPKGTALAAGATMVLCKHRPTLERIGGAALQTTLPIEGKLKNSGETVRIEDPQGRVADEVTYDNDQAEAKAADGTGSSLHRVRFTPPEGGEVWRAAAPTPGRFKTSDVTGS